MNALPIAILRGHWRGWAAEISVSMRAGVRTCRSGSIRWGGRSITATGFAGRTPRFTSQRQKFDSKDCLRLREHFLSHAILHRRFAILPGSTGSHCCSSEVIRSTLPAPLLPDNFVNARVRWRSPAQSYSCCNLADKNEVPSRFVLSHSRSNSTSSPDPLAMSGG